MDAVLEHWHEKPLVVEISSARAGDGSMVARSPEGCGLASVGGRGKPRTQKELRRGSPVFSPEEDIAGAAPKIVQFDDRPVVLDFQSISHETGMGSITRGSNDKKPDDCIETSDERSPMPSRRRVPSRAVQWMAAVTLQRAYRRRTQHVAPTDNRTGHTPVMAEESGERFAVPIGTALERQRDARRKAALRAVARQQTTEPERSQPAADARRPAAHLLSSDALIRSKSCSTVPLSGCSSRTLVEAHFERGALGLRIAEYARPGRAGALLRVEEIQPGSAAAGVPDLRIGMTLLQINGADVRYAGHTCRRHDDKSTRWRLSTATRSSSTEKSWFDTVMERMAQRPLTLIFVAEQSSAGSTQSAPSSSTQQWDGQVSPVSAAEWASPPPSPASLVASPTMVSSVDNMAEISVNHPHSSGAPVSTRKNRPRQTTSSCCAARPTHSRT